MDDKPTVRRRMEALGWVLCVCEDTCIATWVKAAPGRPGSVYQTDAEYVADLERCQAEYGYDRGESAYG